MAEEFDSEELLEHIFEQVAAEVSAGHFKPGLQAMAAASTEGDEAKAKALYLQLRAKQIAKEMSVQVAKEQAAREKVEQEKAQAEAAKNREAAYEEYKENRRDGEYDLLLNQDEKTALIQGVILAVVFTAFALFIISVV